MQAVVAGTCDTISFRTIAKNGGSIRPVLFDFTGLTIDTLGVEAAAMYSYTKSQQNICTNDLRSLQVGASRIRYTYMHWQNASGEYRVRWSDVQVTCTFATRQCATWKLVPISSAEVLKVVQVKGAQYQYESRGFFQMPFELVLTAQ